jgi:hypothetical protein
VSFTVVVVARDETMTPLSRGDIARQSDEMSAGSQRIEIW